MHAKWNDPEFRARTRANQSIGSQASWDDPERRARRLQKAAETRLKNGTLHKSVQQKIRETPELAEQRTTKLRAKAKAAHANRTPEELEAIAEKKRATWAAKSQQEIHAIGAKIVEARSRMMNLLQPAPKTDPNDEGITSFLSGKL
jgi:hypothetical protein